MKKTLLFAALFIGAVAVSCGPSEEEKAALQAKIDEALNPTKTDDAEKEGASKKGAWSEEDKKLAHDAVETLRADLEATYGEYTDDFLDCYLGKAEMNYDNYNSANNDLEGMQKIATECTDDITQQMIDDLSEGDGE